MIASPVKLPPISRGMLSDMARRKDGRWHPTAGIGVVLEPDGTVAMMGDWEINALLDEGEYDVLADWLTGTAITTKYLCLLKGTAPADTDTMAFLAGGTNGEIGTPGSGGYSRIAVATGDWGGIALNSGDMQTTAAQKTFGANSSGGTWNITSVGIVTAATGQTSGSGKFLVDTPTSVQPTPIGVGQSFLWTQTIKAQ